MIRTPGSPSAPDALGELLGHLRIDGVDYGRCTFSPPWSIRFPAQDAARFHHLIEGTAWLRLADGDWTALGAGRSALVPRGAEHVLASEPGLPSGPTIAEIPKTAISRNTYEVVHGAPTPVASLLVCCSARISGRAFAAVLSAMPPVVLVTDDPRGRTIVRCLTEAMEAESLRRRIGDGTVLALLADALLAIVIRDWVERAGTPGTGLLSALGHPRLSRSVRALHGQPDRDWSVPELAREAGMSRSSFAADFRHATGSTPLRYLLGLRMQLARTLLVGEGLSIGEVARRVGYGSEAAFSRAFRRTEGVGPAEFRSSGSSPRDQVPMALE